MGLFCGEGDHMRPIKLLNESKSKIRKSNPIILTFIISLMVLLTSGFLYWQNNAIGITSIVYENKRVPQAFDGFKIVQISDLHNKDFHGKLAEKIIEQKPDIIVITGDMIDSRKTNVADAMKLMEEIQGIAQVYYVSGNHEARSPSFDVLREALLSMDVVLLDGKYAHIEKSGESIGILGVADPLSIRSDSFADDQEYVLNSIDMIYKSAETRAPFNILLSHRPELLKAYALSGVDMVFSGHAHGGQIRLPFIGGVIAPNQGFFPELTEGQHTLTDSDRETTLIISRGLGNSLFPFRIFNRPELVVVTLKQF